MSQKSSALLQTLSGIEEWAGVPVKPAKTVRVDSFCMQARRSNHLGHQKMSQMAKLLLIDLVGPHQVMALIHDDHLSGS